MKGYRKVIVGVLGLGLGFALGMLGKLTPEFVALVVSVMGLFSAANAVEHKYNRGNDAAGE